MRWKFFVNDKEYGEFSTLQELKELIEPRWHRPENCWVYNQVLRFLDQELDSTTLWALITDWDGTLNFRFEVVSYG